ncbi:MAG: hypothetical protein H3C47_00070 [Candidatus Cloacimonetes bacterium]|nr:hypothetical protein [Candidatus Cloacimonadota bacterium]
MVFLLLLALFLNVPDANSLRTEVSGNALSLTGANPASSGRYQFDDLMEAATILMAEKSYDQAQEVLEMALYLKPRDLSVFQMLAEIYESTKQSEKLLSLAESVSSYILPQGREDPFYEKMLTMSVILNSNKDPNKAWNSFLRLYEGLSHRRGRQYELIKELENGVHVPFLARIYEYLVSREHYGDFRWGQVADYYLFHGHIEKAKLYFDQELKKPDFDRIFLYSYARILYDRKQFSLCQVYINVAMELSTSEKMTEKLKQLQHLLSAWGYEYGLDEIQQEADLFFRFREKSKGIDKLKSLLLVSTQNPGTLFNLGRMLMEYPKDLDTWDEGSRYLLQYARLVKAPEDNTYLAGELLLKNLRQNELASFLQILKERFPDWYQKDRRLSTQIAFAMENLLDSARVLMRLGTDDDLVRRYLNTCRELNPASLEVYHMLFEVLNRTFAKEIDNRQLLSPKSIEIAERFAYWVEQDAITAHSEVGELYEYAGRILSMRPRKNREYSRELAFLKRALDTNPSLHKARLQMAKNYLDFDYPMQAAEILERMLDIAKDDQESQKQARIMLIQACRLNAQAFWAQASYFLVISQMQKAIAANDNELVDLESTLWLSYSYQATDAFDKNLSLLKSALQQFGDSAEVWYLYALSWQGSYEYEKAIEAYDKVLSMSDSENNRFASVCRENRDSLKRILQYRKGQE